MFTSVTIINVCLACCGFDGSKNVPIFSTTRVIIVDYCTMIVISFLVTVSCASRGVRKRCKPR